MYLMDYKLYVILRELLHEMGFTLHPRHNPRHESLMGSETNAPRSFSFCNPMPNSHHAPNTSLNVNREPEPNIKPNPNPNPGSLTKESLEQILPEQILNRPLKMSCQCPLPSLFSLSL